MSSSSWDMPCSGEALPGAIQLLTQQLKPHATFLCMYSIGAIVGIPCMRWKVLVYAYKQHVIYDIYGNCCLKTLSFC